MSQQSIGTESQCFLRLCRSSVNLQVHLVLSLWYPTSALMCRQSYSRSCNKAPAAWKVSGFGHLEPVFIYGSIFAFYSQGELLSSQVCWRIIASSEPVPCYPQMVCLISSKGLLHLYTSTYRVIMADTLLVKHQSQFDPLAGNYHEDHQDGLHRYQLSSI